MESTEDPTPTEIAERAKVVREAALIRKRAEHPKAKVRPREPAIREVPEFAFVGCSCDDMR